MIPRTPRPSRFYVRRIIGEEAVKANLPADAVINIHRRARFAAFAAMRRIASETGCTASAIADVWGCGQSVVWTALNDPPAEPAPITQGPTLFDERTIEHLRWAHGDARTAQIIAGKDPRTRADLARWNALGSHRGKAA